MYDGSADQKRQMICPEVACDSCTIRNMVCTGVATMRCTRCIIKWKECSNLVTGKAQLIGPPAKDDYKVSFKLFLGCIF